MNKLTLKMKLMFLLIGSLVVLTVLILAVSAAEGIVNTQDEKKNQLKSIVAAKKQHITKYFNSIEGLIVSTASSKSTQDALTYMSRGLKNLSTEVAADVDMNAIKSEIQAHYEKHYINDINFSLPNIPSKNPTQAYLPQTDKGLIAQYIYIVKNSANIGEKNDMTKSTSLSSSYTFSHAKFHNTFNTMLKRFALYDIFLVDMNGDIVYSTFKEKDYATNLKAGPYANSGIAEVNNKAYNIGLGEVSFSDFKPYEPSYNTPASFIATPVFNERNKRIGNLIMQFPIDSIDEIMNFGGEYETSGMGKTGFAYLVGSDHTMRNNHRFIKKINDANVKSSGTTIALYEMKNSVINAALSNQTGADTFEHDGKSMIGAYSGLKIFDQQWAVIAEIDEGEALEHIFELTLILIAISLVVLIILIFVAVMILKNTVVNPLQEFERGLMSFFKYLNNETSTIQFLNEKSDDELGKMSKVVNENIRITKDNIEKDKNLINETVRVLSEFEKGDLCQRINSNTSNPGLNELKDVLNKMGTNLEKNIDNILAVLEKYTHYDYLDKVDSSSLKEHLLKLANGVNSLGDSITDMLVINKTNGVKLDSSSDVLLESVTTLTNNANEAAASIEETSAALEEINGNLVANSQNVQKMSTYAHEVTSSVKEGEDLAKKTTVAMDQINEQVTSINDAITVIDQIAFQTNILSLNAAVEAATAGEAGKGFAVVAQEVRNLASRSAEAAKEIKELVENANLKANEGKTIADSMISGYSQLSENISNTIELIEAVSTSSQEQQLGISQISETVSTLDKQTQENASVAQSTSDIAQDTDIISKEIVSNANEKEFRGKDDIKVDTKKVSTKKSKANLTQEVKPASVKPRSPKPIHTKVEKREPVKAVKSTASAQTVVANNNDDDEWESF